MVGERADNPISDNAVLQGVFCKKRNLVLHKHFFEKTVENRTGVLYNVRISNLKVSIAGAFVNASELPAKT